MSRHPARTSPTRASDADRERTVAALREHYTAGRLTHEELEERSRAAYASVQRRELQTLTADLPYRSQLRARARRAALRGHATTYAATNMGLLGIWAADGAGAFWPAAPLLGWGVVLGAHAWRVLRR